MQDFVENKLNKPNMTKKDKKSETNSHCPNCLEKEEKVQNLKVIYEDNHIIVVEKTPNIPSQSDKTGDIDMLTIVKQYIKEKYSKPGNVYLGLVHRLDRPVGGIMIFAKTSKAAGRLSEQIRNKTFRKKYLAVVDGKIDKKMRSFRRLLI